MEPNIFRSLTARWALSITLAATSLALAAQQDQWPVRFEANGAKYQVFAPQPESITGERFTARMAVGVQRAQDEQPVFGAIWGDGVLALEPGARIGPLASFTVNDARFPSLSDEAELAAIREAITAELPRASGPISTEWLASTLKKEQQLGSSFANDAPEIIYTEKPSALVYIDGAPRYEQMKESLNDSDPVYATSGGIAIERVTNTPYMIMRPMGGDHYLYGSKLWFRSRAIEGPWRQVDNVPADLRAIGEKAESTAEVTASDDQRKVPEIVVRTTPAELLDLDGPPQFEPVQNTSLLYATNTNRNFFLDIGTQQYYLLASGRWFATRDAKSGPWNYVPSDKLPAAFASIPEGSKKDAVLAHISGTDAALDASRDANVPKTAQIDRSTASVTVTYQGSPEFARIAGTNVEYARNASTNVLRINGRYYVCDNAVWFEGDSPDGPWMVSTQVPAEVSSIPPSSPVYNVRYVYIYDSTPQYVYGGYTPGYLGSYGFGGSLFYGTGYNYGGGWGNYYNPWPTTWGFGMGYDPWNGWGFGGNWGWGWNYGGYGGFGHHAWGHGWWGSAYNNPHYFDPHHGGYYGHHNNGYGGYGQHAYNAQSSHASRPVGVYAGRNGAGIRPAPIARPLSGSNMKPAGADGTIGRPMTKPGTRPAFTDARGNTFGASVDGTKPTTASIWGRTPAQGRPAVAPSTTTVGTDRPVQRPITDARGNTYRPNTGDAVRNDNGSWGRVAPPAPARTEYNTTRPNSARPDVQSRPSGNQRPAYQQDPQRQAPQRNYSAPSAPRYNNGTQRGNSNGGYRPQQAPPSRTYSAPSAPRNNGGSRGGGYSGGGNRGGGGGSMHSGGGGGGSRGGGSIGGGSRGGGGGGSRGGGRR